MKNEHLERLLDSSCRVMIEKLGDTNWEVTVYDAVGPNHSHHQGETLDEAVNPRLKEQGVGT